MGYTVEGEDDNVHENRYELPNQPSSTPDNSNFGPQGKTLVFECDNIVFDYGSDESLPFLPVVTCGECFHPNKCNNPGCQYHWKTWICIHCKHDKLNCTCELGSNSDAVDSQGRQVKVEVTEEDYFDNNNGNGNGNGNGNLPQHSSVEAQSSPPIAPKTEKSPPSQPPHTTLARAKSNKGRRSCRGVPIPRKHRNTHGNSTNNNNNNNGNSGSGNGDDSNGDTDSDSEDERKKNNNSNNNDNTPQRRGKEKPQPNRGLWENDPRTGYPIEKYDHISPYLNNYLRREMEARDKLDFVEEYHCTSCESAVDTCGHNGLFLACEYIEVTEKDAKGIRNVYYICNECKHNQLCAFVHQLCTILSLYVTTFCGRDV